MTVTERMQQIIREVLDDDELILTDDTTAGDIEAWDSLAHINIMFTLESEFGVHFSDAQLYQFHNIGELRRFLDDALSA